MALTALSSLPSSPCTHSSFLLQTSRQSHPYRLKVTDFFCYLSVSSSLETEPSGAANPAPVQDRFPRTLPQPRHDVGAGGIRSVYNFSHNYTSLKCECTGSVQDWGIKGYLLAYTRASSNSQCSHKAPARKSRRDITQQC